MQSHRYPATAVKPSSTTTPSFPPARKVHRQTAQEISRDEEIGVTGMKSTQTHTSLKRCRDSEVEASVSEDDAAGDEPPLKRHQIDSLERTIIQPTNSLPDGPVNLAIQNVVLCRPDITWMMDSVALEELRTNPQTSKRSSIEVEGCRRSVLPMFVSETHCILVVVHKDRREVITRLDIFNSLPREEHKAEARRTLNRGKCATSTDASSHTWRFTVPDCARLSTSTGRSPECLHTRISSRPPGNRQRRLSLPRASTLRRHGAPCTTRTDSALLSDHDTYSGCTFAQDVGNHCSKDALVWKKASSRDSHCHSPTAFRSTGRPQWDHTLDRIVSHF